jgi:hypothetical protein
MAAGPRDSILNVYARCGCRERSEDGKHAITVLGQYGVGPMMRIGIEAFRGTAPSPLVGRTDVMHLVQVRRTYPEHIGNVFRQLTEFLLAFAHGRFRTLAFDTQGDIFGD